MFGCSRAVLDRLGGRVGKLGGGVGMPLKEVDGPGGRKVAMLIAHPPGGGGLPGVCVVERQAILQLSERDGAAAGLAVAAAEEEMRVVEPRTPNYKP